MPLELNPPSPSLGEGQVPRVPAKSGAPPSHSAPPPPPVATNSLDLSSAPAGQYLLLVTSEPASVDHQPPSLKRRLAATPLPKTLCGRLWRKTRVSLGTDFAGLGCKRYHHTVPRDEQWAPNGLPISTWLLPSGHHRCQIRPGHRHCHFQAQSSSHRWRRRKKVIEVHMTPVPRHPSPTSHTRNANFFLCCA